MDAKIFSVQNACFHINKSKPPQIVVHAAGTVNSSGWSNGRLIPWTYVDQPQDGVQDFDFIATAPSGFVLWVMSPLAGLGSIQHGSWMKGVRVHAATNNVEISLSDDQCCVEGAVIASDTFPWPW